MNQHYARQNALAFGGGNGSKTGSSIRMSGGARSGDTISNIIDNANYDEPDQITLDHIGKVLKIKVPPEEVDDSAVPDDDDTMAQYSVGIMLN